MKVLAALAAISYHREGITARSRNIEIESNLSFLTLMKANYSCLLNPKWPGISKGIGGETKINAANTEAASSSGELARHRYRCRNGIGEIRPATSVRSNRKCMSDAFLKFGSMIASLTNEKSNKKHAGVMTSVMALPIASIEQLCGASSLRLASRSHRGKTQPKAMQQKQTVRTGAAQRSGESRHIAWRGITKRERLVAKSL